MANLKKIREALDLICEQGRALRQGGPAAEDLHELSEALDTAVNLAAEAIGETQESLPVAWTVPGNDTADANGFIPAKVISEGEFTKPLYAAAT